MNFIEETNKHVRALEAWKKGMGFSDREALQDLADIWDEFKAIPERSLVIYGKANANVPKTDIACSSCVFDMLTFVWNWRKILEHEVPLVDFKGVPQASIEVYHVEVLSKVVETILKPEVDKLTDKKMHEIRSIAKSIGIEYTNQTKKSELIELINAKA